MKPRVAIVDFGLGNLFSVQHACAMAELDAFITSSPADLDAAAAVILPGVGAFGDAMAVLRETGLDRAIMTAVEADKVIVGICLGMQLLCTESEEFGAHRGLGIVDGVVRRLPDGMRGPMGLAAKVPEVGWNAVRAPRPDAWQGTPLADTPDGAAFHFVHSYYVVPRDPHVVLSTSTYGDVTYCSSLRRRNIAAFQFHPERSGRVGLGVYRSIARQLRR